MPDPAAARPADLVGRRFSPPAPDRLWVADFTYVPTWSGMVYVAFVIDAYSRQILGCRAATTMRTSLVLDALEQAIWTRQRGGQRSLAGLVHHHDAGSQPTFNGVTGDMTGWQITLIAVRAALVGAVVGVLVDRARAARRHRPATAA